MKGSHIFTGVNCHTRVMSLIICPINSSDLEKRISDLGQIAIIPCKTADSLIFYDHFALLLGTILGEFELKVLVRFNTR